ncbi:hypothetical protein [Pseudodesulfovibrio sp.]|uniref:hypothetical protein n=1 Tax=Pseudodesulfovibrio sp. TaxID=2035812 RepID=UPI00262063AA|nr:hypothetical protein [Pseudodesulfovibrio sp.]MDD3310987.1 hypothetical protein [Pseudodesulfovibrio sp.]
MQCYQCKALRAAEAQVMRNGKLVGELVKLLKSVREDGGLTSAQAEHLDRLALRADAVSTGRDHSEDHTALLREVAIALGPMPVADRNQCPPESTLVTFIPFGLWCRVAAEFDEPEARTVATEVERV